MALVKQNKRLAEVTFSFDERGEVTGLTAQVNYTIVDDITGQVLTQLRDGVNIWTKLTVVQQGIANTLGKRLKQLAEA